MVNDGGAIHLHYNYWFNDQMFFHPPCMLYYITFGCCECPEWETVVVLRKQFFLLKRGKTGIHLYD